MDPQQRMLIEVSYEALESAGISLPKVAGSRTGVYVGVFTHDYYEMLRKDAENMPTFTVHGTASTAMAGRLSWLWDLRGPSFALDTACSSGLVALHLAVQGLRAGETDSALVGGSNLLIAPDMFKVATSASFLAPDGRSKAFDDSADGYGRGEGIGVVVLKRVEDAIRDGDPIRAIIRETACNQDGRTPGMTLPSSEAQATLIREAYSKAGLNMQDTGYVEGMFVCALNHQMFLILRSRPTNTYKYISTWNRYASRRPRRDYQLVQNNCFGQEADTKRKAAHWIRKVKCKTCCVCPCDCGNVC